MLSQREKMILFSVVGIEEHKAVGIKARAAAESNPRFVVSLII
jgi:hypothetical protein